jgi:hypothetical protein
MKMTEQPVLAFFLSPPAVPIHDNGNVTGQPLQINIFPRRTHRRHFNAKPLFATLGAQR